MVAADEKETIEERDARGAFLRAWSLDEADDRTDLLAVELLKTCEWPARWQKV